MDNINIFELLYEKPQTSRKIYLIELFAGYGSQAFALKYLGADFEHHKICEWNWKSFAAYKTFHMGDDNTNYSDGMSKDELIDYLFSRGISADWNKPMTYDQIKRMKEKQLREIYNNIQSTHNLVDIQKVRGKDLEMKDNEFYLMTYSFPCQDLSLAGLRNGMSREGNTRSGLLWEVERILKECHKLGKVPDVLMMENVPQVHGVGNMDNFKLWMLELEKLGYQNYWQDLIATDYGIPQIRNRTFMISLQGYYEFPKPIPLTKKLKDILEEQVDEKYYLSDKLLNYFLTNSEKQKAKGNNFKFTVLDGTESAKCIREQSGNRMDDNFIYDE